MAPRGMGSLIGMPTVGLLIGKIDPRKLVAVGLAVGAGYWDIFGRSSCRASVYRWCSSR